MPIRPDATFSPAAADITSFAISSAISGIFRQSHGGQRFGTENRSERKQNSVTVSAELPGIEEKDIDVQISSDGYLSISGEKRHQSEENNKGNYFSEISYGMFRRTIPLPWDLDYDKANADYDDGVLKVVLPKSQTEQQKFKKINVKKSKRSQENED